MAFLPDDPLLVQALSVLPALALAAGVDLYLALLLLGLAPATGLWESLPGALGDLASPGVILLTGAFYLAELAADRGFATALVWHGLHAIIRPLAGALLALLVLDGRPGAAVAGGALLAALLASAAHAAVTGGSLLLRMDRSPPARPPLVSLLEDVCVLGLVVLALDRPGWSALAAGALVAGTLPTVSSPLRAFVFSVRLAVGRIRRILTGGGWTRPDDLPRWVRQALARETMAPGGLRGTRAAGIGLPGRPRLVLGWVVVRGETPLFVHGRGPQERVDLGELRPRSLREGTFLRQAGLARPVDLLQDEEGSRPALLLPRDGPSLETLRAEFRLD